jgi:hypothetical protein
VTSTIRSIPQEVPLGTSEGLPRLSVANLDNTGGGATLPINSSFLHSPAGVAIGNYAGILSYLILPAIFVIGLVLIPIGLANILLTGILKVAA